MVVKWTFLDPTDSSTVQFEINPKDGGSLSAEKHVTSYSTVCVGGKTLLMEGSEAVQEITFSGIIRTQTAIDNMIVMYNKHHQIQLTDDLGREFMIIISKFVPKRERASHTPWKHSYEITAVIVDWP